MYTMTFEELKNRIRDLGFEEDTTMREYESIVANATDKAVQTIYDTIVYPYREYFNTYLGLDDEGNSKVIRPNKITVETEDTAEIGLPDRVLNLVPLLASYFVWLDDDQVKASVYKNQYEDVKDLLILDFQRPQKLTFYGGLRFD